jgi:hypothetical protein
MASNLAVAIDQCLGLQSLDITNWSRENGFIFERKQFRAMDYLGPSCNLQLWRYVALAITTTLEGVIGRDQ